MPRGGGGGFRGGGGFGGGFRGGFSGGGFRGGGATFRSRSMGSSGRPFGRTGASRTVTGQRRGPYRHTYYRPHRRYYYRYGWYRPWYYRWWYSPWWSGYYYRPWFYSPVYIVGGISLVIIAALIILPLFGVALLFPFNGADSSGDVNYRSTKTLYFNEYWYEYEYINAGNDITFSVQSSPSLITFAIYDAPFESLPTTTYQGSYSDTLSLTSGEFGYYSLFLRPGSSLSYSYTASNQVDFFIVNADNFNEWNQYGDPSYFDFKENTQSYSGQITINRGQDYYLVWYNDLTSAVSVDYTINYIANDVVDFTAADYYVEAVDYIPETTFTVPSSGDWYFFVYFDPMVSPEESTDITFDVTYETGVSSSQRWIDFYPVLIGIIVVIAIVIILAYVARQGQKRQKTKAKQKVTQVESPKTLETVKPAEVPKSPYKLNKCVNCGSTLNKDAVFCPNCGKKVLGRDLGTSDVVTPAKSKICSLCGYELKPGAKFCAYCGTKVQQ